MARLYALKNKCYAKTTIVGTLSRDPEWKEVGTGLCKLSLPVTESWKDKGGEWQEETTWYDVDVWGESGKWVMDRGIKKGDLIRVEGKMSQRKRDDGNVFWSLKPDFRGVSLIASLENGDSGEYVPRPAATVADNDDDDDGLPF